MLKILIVDDEEFARENLKLLLQEFCEGIGNIETAEGAVQARSILQEFKPDLVFLDIMMPGEDGFSLLKSLEEKPFQLVFTTAFRDHAIRAFKENAIDYLEKPIDIEELKKGSRKSANLSNQKTSKRS
jgi:two-component system LytT family response regulator